MEFSLSSPCLSVRVCESTVYANKAIVGLKEGWGVRVFLPVWFLFGLWLFLFVKLVLLVVYECVGFFLSARRFRYWWYRFAFYLFPFASFAYVYCYYASPESSLPVLLAVVIVGFYMLTNWVKLFGDI